MKFSIWAFWALFGAILMHSLAKEEIPSSDPPSDEVATTVDLVLPTDVALMTEESSTDIISTVSVDSCFLPPNSGPCTAELVRYFYDANLERCRQFIYGGCEGNGNVFFTEEDCLEACLPKDAASDSETSIEDSALASPTAVETDPSLLTLANGDGETSFTFSSDYPFIQLKAVDISNFQLRYFHRCFVRIYYVYCVAYCIFTIYYNKKLFQC